MDAGRDMKKIALPQVSTILIMKPPASGRKKMGGVL